MENVEKIWKEFDELKKKYKILKEVSKILRVDEEHVVKTIKRFLNDIKKGKASM